MLGPNPRLLLIPRITVERKRLSPQLEESSTPDSDMLRFDRFPQSLCFVVIVYFGIAFCMQRYSGP